MMTEPERELINHFMAVFAARFAEIFENAATRIEATAAPDVLKRGLMDGIREYLGAEESRCEREIAALAAGGSMKKPERVIASVTCGTPPASVRTRDDWTVWRKEEDARMANEAAAQVVASLESRAATRH